MHPRTRLLIALALACAIPAAAAHAAPPNDNFAAAAPLALGAQVLGDNLAATAESGEKKPMFAGVIEQDCVGVINAPRCTSSVWYTFQVGSTGTYTIETCDGSTDLDSALAVWHGSTLTTLSEDGSDGDSCPGGVGGEGSRVQFTASAGVQYHVEVAGESADQGVFYLRSYSGPAHATGPEPDTVIGGFHSFAEERVSGGYSTSGPRQTASFDFVSDKPGAAFQCSLDGSPFSACSSPQSFDGLSGSHTFGVRAIVSGAPDPTPAVQRFTLDSTPPDTFIVSGPTNPTSVPSPPFFMLGSERTTLDRFLCALDSQPAAPSCTSSETPGTLCNGLHSFRVAATDHANNVDLSPAVRTFTETGGSACAPPQLLGVSATAFTPTEEGISIPEDVHGAGGFALIEYGRTSAYGSRIEARVVPGGLPPNHALEFLLPNTLYHYRVTLTTPAGSDTTGDLSFTTLPLGVATLPTVSLGAPTVVGSHAAAFPVTVTGGDNEARYGVFVGSGPASQASPQFFARDASGQDVVVPAGGGRSTRRIDVVDLQPGTYHVRGFVQENALEPNYAITPEVTFVVPPPPTAAGPPPGPAAKRFRLRRRFIKIGKIRRRSRSITVVVRHLPRATRVNVTVNARVQAAAVKRLGTGKAKASRRGVARAKVKLGRRARRLLRNRHTRSLSIKVRVKPPGTAASSLSFRRRLGR